MSTRLSIINTSARTGKLSANTMTWCSDRRVKGYTSRGKGCCMVELICPSCDKEIALESDQSGEYECPFCENEFQYDSICSTEDKVNYLLEHLQSDSLPDTIILLRENQYREGGRSFQHIRSFGDFVVYIIGSMISMMFLAIPIIWFTTLSFFIITDSGNVTNWPVACFATLIPVPIMYAVIPGFLKGIFNPEPLLQVNNRTYFDTDKKVLTITSDNKNLSNGQISDIEIQKCIEVNSSHRITVLYDPGSDGGMKPPSHSICMWEQSNQMDRAVVSFGQKIAKNSEKESINEAKELSNRLGIPLTEPIVQSKLARYGPEHSRIIWN